jgi:hypothetical protein
MLSLKSQKKNNIQKIQEEGVNSASKEEEGKKTSSKHDSHFKLINYHDGTIIGKLWQGFGEF